MMQKEGLSTNECNSIDWDSFYIAFDKLTSAEQIITTKTIYSFWSTNSRHIQDKGQFKECCLCGSNDEEWIYVLTCNGTGTIIYRTVSWAEVCRDVVKWPIHQDIWVSLEHDPPHTTLISVPHFVRVTLCILLNNYVASQTSTGWHNLMNGMVSKEWYKLWAK
jgi:hypothetical protein